MELRQLGFAVPDWVVQAQVVGHVLMLEGGRLLFH